MGVIISISFDSAFDNYLNNIDQIFVHVLHLIFLV